MAFMKEELFPLTEALKRVSATSVALATVPVLVLSIVVVILFSWTKSKSGKYPPIASGLPIIGSIAGFMGLEKVDGKWKGTGPLNFIRQNYDTLGSVFTAPLFHKRITFLLSPEVTNHFFKASEKDLSQKEVYQYSVPTFGKGVVFDVDYSVRLEQFKFFADALKVNKMRSYVDMMVQEAEAHFGRWADEGEIDLKEEFAHLVLLTASRCLLGREVREQIFEKVSELFHILDMGMLPISVIFPYLPIKAHRERDRAREEVGQIFKTIIRARKASGKQEPDMLQTFIDSKYKSTGKQTTEAECAGLLIAALFAGQHTSSLTSTWTGAYLSVNKEWLAEVEQEQREVLSRHGDKLDYDILSEMDKLHLSIKEVLRLHPPLILLLRHVNTEFEVTTAKGKQFTIPKGHIVATSPTFAGRLPTVYSNPDKYDPKRFMAGREEDKAGGNFSYISFGGGRHGCMGETFAYMQIKTLWSVLMRNFELELLCPFPEDDYESSIVVGPKGKVLMRYKRRKLTASAAA
eukprot:TRINITY_DN743_c0_g1_i1.p1 TRINITY_DN743_c0_g1~~TRINITY_DN743_c0_g1_i1.p1  ORF type:complete len:518 (+),score=106.77 TRINITY_DN743_c0_g1_i1:134-1687(+)